MRYFLFLFFFFLCFPFSSWSKEHLEGVCVSVADGDTITLQTPQGDLKKIRLYGVDCPEKGQAFGVVAKEFVEQLLHNQNVHAKVFYKDKYGRAVALVFIGNSLLQEILLQEGLTWVYPKYCQESFCAEWYQLQEIAQEKQKGLWHYKNIAPYEWRKQH